jgi:uncharacterized protein YfaS (alpha-2-macroglobulin family)
LRDWSIPVDSPLNEVSYTPVDLVEGGGRLEPGIYCLELHADGISHSRWQHQHLLVVSEVNLTLKSDEDQVLAWATDLETGVPVPGLILRAVDNKGVEHSASITDSNGLAVLSSDESSNWYGTTIISHRPFTMGSTQWNDGISVWEFGFDSGYTPDWRAHIYTDRPIYRPDQTVYFKGVIRAEDDARYALPHHSTVDVTIRDAAWEIVYEETLPLDEFGAFAGELALTKEAALGNYSLRASIKETSFSGSFQVAAYRPPESSLMSTALAPTSSPVIRSPT